MAAIKMHSLIFGDVINAELYMDGDRGHLDLTLDAGWDPNQRQPETPDRDEVRRAIEDELGRPVTVAAVGELGHGPEGHYCDTWEVEVIPIRAVLDFSCELALHDLALALSRGEDPEELAWGPDHASALSAFLWETVGEMSEDTWHMLFDLARDTYADWMQRRAWLGELRAEQLTDGWTVVDSSGMRWWPSEESQERLKAAKDPAFEVLRLCIGGEVAARGWSC